MTKKLLVFFVIGKCFIASCLGQADWRINLKAHTLLYLVTGGGVAGKYFYSNCAKMLTIGVSLRGRTINDDTAYLNRKEAWITNAMDYFVLGKVAHAFAGYEITLLDPDKQLQRIYNHRIVDSLSIKEVTTLDERMMILGHVAPYDFELQGKEDSVILRLWPRRKHAIPLPENIDQYAGFLTIAVKDWVLDYEPKFIRVCYMISPTGQQIDSYTYDLKSKGFLKSYRAYLHYHTWRRNGQF